jgi:hypothetical protein
VAIPLFDVPPWEVIERWWAREIAGPEIECRVVPRTSDRLPDDESVGEGSTVVRTLASDGIAAAADARDDDGIIAHSSSDEPAVHDKPGRNTGGEVGTFRTLGISTHDSASSTVSEPCTAVAIVAMHIRCTSRGRVADPCRGDVRKWLAPAVRGHRLTA